MIENNIDVDLRILAPMMTDYIVDAIIDWARSNKPEIAEILDTEKGREWLRRNIEKLLSCS